MEGRRRLRGLRDRAAVLALQFEHALLAQAEVHVHRIDRVDRRQQRLVGRDEPADLELRTAERAVDRRVELGVAEVEFGGLERGARSLDRGPVGVALGDRGIKLLLADGVNRRQRLNAREIALRLVERRLRLRERRLGLRQRRLVRLRINREQQLALAHRRAFLRDLAFEQTADARANFDRVQRFRLGDVVDRDRGRSRRRRDHRHGDGCRGRRRRLARAGGEHQQRHRQREDDRGTAVAHRHRAGSGRQRRGTSGRHCEGTGRRERARRNGRIILR